MPTVLISGAAHGLGAAFVRAYSSLKDFTIIAVDREICHGDSDNFHSIQVDVSSQSSIETLAQQLAARPIDIVIHSAGVRGLVPAIEEVQQGNVAACETLDVMNHDTLMRTFEINTVGTFMLLRALLPSLRKARSPKVVVMSSRMGSIMNNEHPRKDAGSAYAYRASKAALNTIVRSFAADIPDVTFVLCHPGRVETRLVKWREDGAITANESVGSILPLIDTWGPRDSGRFYDRLGEPIPW